MKLNKKCLILAGAITAMVLAGCGAGNQATGQPGKAPSPDTAKKEAQADGTGAKSQGKPAGASGEKTKLVLWMPPFGTEDTLDKQVWSDILKPFEEENNAEVSIEIVPWSNYEEKYLTGISSGQGPDVGYMYNEMINDFIDTGAITPFDSYLTDADRSNFYYLDKGVIDGKQYGMPIVVGSARVLFYNKAILKEAGVEDIPQTWDDFIAACQKIKAIGKTPFLQQWGDKSKGELNSIFFPYLWQAGGELFTQDGTKAAFNSDAGLKAAQFIHDLRFQNGFLPDSITSMSEDDVLSEFSSGKVAFAVAATNRSEGFTKAGIDWGFTVSLKDQEQGTFTAADSLVMISASKHKDMAMKMIRYMLSGPSMTRFHQMAPYPPVAKDEDYHDDPAFKTLYEDHKDAFHVLPAVQGSAAVYDNLYKNLQLMMLGQLTPQQAISNAADYADTTLSQK